MNKATASRLVLEHRKKELGRSFPMQVPMIFQVSQWKKLLGFLVSLGFRGFGFIGWVWRFSRFRVWGLRQKVVGISPALGP